MSSSPPKIDRRFNMLDLTIFVALLSVALGMIGAGWRDANWELSASEKLVNPLGFAGLMLLGGLLGAGVAMVIAGRQRAYRGLIYGVLATAALLFLFSGGSFSAKDPGDRLDQRGSGLPHD